MYRHIRISISLIYLTDNKIGSDDNNNKQLPCK